MPFIYSIIRNLVFGVSACALCAVAAPAWSASPDAVYATKGVVASRSATASEVGAAILRDGGNAVDAAVAMGFALAVTYPSAGNLGGGGFMVIRLADGTVMSNDHRETAPASASRDMYLDAEGDLIDDLSRHSHLAVGVPGSVAGLIDVLERLGTFSLTRVIDPAIRLAQRGFVLDHDLAQQFARRREQFAKHPATLAVFTREDGSAYVAGDVFRQPDLAKTLKRIRQKGKAGFYQGATARLLVLEMQRGGGLITMEDLANYESRWREPVTGTYRGYDVISMPPPSSGGVLLLQMLNMLENHDVKSLGFGSAATVHLMVEAERRAYADRAEHLGDPDFFPVPVAQLISKPYALDRFDDFDPKKASLSSDIFPGFFPEESPDTTHTSVLDKTGNAVAFTTTLNLSYGSKIVAAGTGVVLNNEMDDFSAKPDTPNFYGLLGRKANEIAPGKRMLSSMTPTIVAKDGQPVLITGSPGGSTIITTTFQVVVNTIDHEMTLSDAVGRPRFHHQWQPDRVIYEPHGLSPDTLAILKAKGHNLIPLPWGRGIGDANSVRRISDKEQRGMADPRNRGAAVGVY